MHGDGTSEKYDKLDKHLEIAANQLLGTDEDSAAILSLIKLMNASENVPDWALQDPEQVKRYLRKSAKHQKVDQSRRREVQRKYMQEAIYRADSANSESMGISIQDEFVRYVRWLVATGNLASVWIRNFEFGMTLGEFVYRSKFQAPTAERPWPLMSSLYYVRKRITIERDLIRKALNCVSAEVGDHEDIDYSKKYSVFARRSEELIVLFKKKLV